MARMKSRDMTAEEAGLCLSEDISSCGLPQMQVTVTRLTSFRWQSATRDNLYPVTLTQNVSNNLRRDDLLVRLPQNLRGTGASSVGSALGETEMPVWEVGPLPGCM